MGGDARSPLAQVTPYDPQKGEAWNREQERQKKEAQAKAPAGRATLAQMVRNNFMLHLQNFDLKRQASDLAKVLPTDVKLLSEVVNDPNQSPERRAKILEVMIYRGASNELTYDAMAPPEPPPQYRDTRFAKQPNPEYQERRANQEAARDAIFKDPRLFDQLTTSRDQLPQGRTAATEVMNTMLRNGGMYGGDTGRQEFEKRLLDVPAETRGRMMYHLEDAGQSSDIHTKGERRTTGYSGGLSAGNAAASAGFEIGKQWDHLPDNHWKEAGKDVTRAVTGDFHDKMARDPSSARSELEQFEKGYRDAEGRGRLPLGPKN